MGESPEVNIDSKVMYMRRLGLEVARHRTQRPRGGALEHW